MPRVPFSDDDESLSTVATSRSAAPAPRGLRIEVVAGPDAGRAASVGLARAIVGRGAGVDVRLADPRVSALHVELAAEGGGVAARDLESRNGTFYCGARVASAVLPSGGVIQLGGSAVRVVLDAEVGAAPPGPAAFGELRGASAPMRELFALLARVARSDLSLLVEGPTGTGKELVARGVHAAGARAAAPFVVLDCAAIPGTLAESVLFGHERGAFTGADRARPGVFEVAGEGTVFLDELGELPVELQPKLLRVLERREVARVGGVEPRPVRARVVAATCRDLRAMVNRGAFREDLYFRLAQARVFLPALRDRREDVPVLVRHFLAGLPDGPRAISDDAFAEICRRDFPGNVRELRHTVERAAMLAEGPRIEASDLAVERMLMGDRARVEPARAVDAADGPIEPYKEAKRTLLEDFERAYLARLLARAGGNLSRASAIAGVERHHLRDLLRKHGLRGAE